MADGGPNIAQQLFATGQIGGSSGSSGGGASSARTPSDDPLETAIRALPKGFNQVLKALLGTGVNTESVGTVSLTAPLDRAESWVDRRINPLAQSLSAAGGPLAQIAASLMRNGVVTDQTGGVGGTVHVDNGTTVAPVIGAAAPVGSGATVDL